MHFLKFILALAGLFVIYAFCPIAAIAFISIFVWLGTK